MHSYPTTCCVEYPARAMSFALVVGVLLLLPGVDDRNGLGTGLDVEFATDIRNMLLDCPFTDGQLCSDIAVGRSLLE